MLQKPLQFAYLPSDCGRQTGQIPYEYVPKPSTPCASKGVRTADTTSEGALLTQTTNTSRARTAFHLVAIGVLTAVGIYAAAALGYAFTLRPAGISVVWPPAGLLLAVFLLTPRNRWAVVAIGAIAGSTIADLTHGLRPLIALGGGTVNCAESLLASWIILRFLPRPVTLSTLRELGVIVIGGGVISNAITSLFGAIVLVSGSQMPYGKAWFVWWTGDGLGMLTFAPVILTLAPLRKKLPSLRDAMEFAVLFVLLCAASELLLGPASERSWLFNADPYVIMPILFWAAVRFGPQASALATLCVTAITLWHAAQGHGPFVVDGRSATATTLQVYAYLWLTSLTGLVAAVILKERQTAQGQSRLLARAIESTDEMVCVTDLTDRFTFVNAAFLKTYGYSATEVIGQTPTILQPPGQPRLAEISSQTQLGGWRGELTNRRKDGSEIVVDLNTSVIRDPDGSVVGLLGVASNVSERVRAEQHLRDVEERMRFALQSAAVGIWEVNLIKQEAFWSETCERIHGLAPGTFNGRLDGLIVAIDPEDRAHVNKTIARAIREHGEPALEYRTVWPDGSTHYISSTGRFFYDDNGTPIRGAGIAIDITDRRGLEAQLRQAQKMEAVGQLAGGVAHDFNNLLTAILGYAGLLADDIAPGDRRRSDVDEIIRAAESAAKLTQQLLAFSRRQVLTLKPLHVGDVANQVAPMLRRLLGETVDLKVVRRENGVVRADAGQLEQVLVNLAVNARDAMPQGGRLILETSDVVLDDEYARNHRGVSAGPYVILAVSDTGHGMDQDTQSRIFEPFFTTKPKGRGTGLGLAVVHGIVNQCGGHVWLYSEVGQGTTFKVYLPRIDALPATQIASGHANTGHGSERILLVEDEDGVREFVEKVLVRRGYSVKAFQRPSAALEYITKHPGTIDALLTDVVLPGIDGPTLADDIRAVCPTMKVLFMSGYTEAAIAHQAPIHAGTSLLQKPFSATDLLSKVREMLDTRPGESPRSDRAARRELV